MGGERLLDDFLLDAPELLFAVVGEDVGNGAGGGLHDRHVGVQ